MTTVDEPAAVWAVVELMGRRRLCGRVSEVRVADFGMLLVEVPDGDGFRRHYHNPSALYGMHPCTEAVARHGAAEDNRWPQLDPVREIEADLAVDGRAADAVAAIDVGAGYDPHGEPPF